MGVEKEMEEVFVGVVGEGIVFDKFVFEVIVGGGGVEGGAEELGERTEDGFF